MSRRHVVLLTYGEPPRPSFFAQLRYSWRILLGLTRSVAAIPAPLLPLLALMRAATRVSTWRRERFGSPLERLTHAQAEGLAAALAAAAPGVGFQVHVAYEFRDPSLLDLVAKLPGDEPVDVVPLYAIDSAFTHQLARETIAAWPGRTRRAAPIRVLDPLPIEVQADLAAAHVRRELFRRDRRGGPQTALVLAAHGTLVDPPRSYETGRIATERIATAIMERLDGAFGAISLGWLNHSFGGRWTEPPVDRALRDVAERGFRRVVYFPFGFLADNAETLLEGRQALRAEPGLEPVHLSCLNADPELMKALARQITAALDDDAPPSHERNGVGRPQRHARGAARRLDQLEPGERTTILRLDGDSGQERRLMELGLVPGTAIEMVRRAPFGDPIEFRVREVSLSLRRCETRRIHVAAP